MSINKQRLKLIGTILEEDTNSAEEEEILNVLLQEPVSKDSLLEHENDRTFGQRAADSLAKFAGSWVFIIFFLSVLVLWVILNTVVLIGPYDAYPFILLNLILSCVAALQAPVIMMSQNRQEEKDRLRAKNDYKVNLKTEIIIEDIYDKLNTLISNQEIILGKINSSYESQEEDNNLDN